MPITRTPLVDDDGSGTTGTVLNNAWLQQLYDQIDAALAAIAPGLTWTGVPHSGANFTAQTGTWTVELADQINVSYLLLNPTTMLLTVDLRATSVSAVTQFLFLKVPAGRTIRATTMTAMSGSNNGAATPAAAYAPASATVVYFLLPTLGTWAVSVNQTNVLGLVVLDLVPIGMVAADEAAPPPPLVIDPTDPRWQVPPL